MNGSETNWVPGFLVLAFGMVAGLIYFLAGRRERAESAGGSDSLVDEYNARYQRLLGELREHIANQHLQDAGVWSAQKARLEDLAAQALRQRDAANHEALKSQARAHARGTATAAASPAQTNSSASVPSSDRMLLRAFLGAAVVGFFVLLGIQLSGATKPREDTQGSGMGAQSPGGAPMQPREEDPRMEALASAVRANPDDVEALVDLALRLVSQQSFQEAKSLLARAAMIDPFQVKGRVGRAVLLAVDGDVAQAQSELERLASLYPEGYQGHLFAGLIALEEGQRERAITQLEGYLASAPADEQPPMLRGEIERMKQEILKSQ